MRSSINDVRFEPYKALTGPLEAAGFAWGCMVSKKGVPHMVVRRATDDNPFAAASICWFKAYSCFKVFWPYPSHQHPQSKMQVNPNVEEVMKVLALAFDNMPGEAADPEALVESLPEVE
jgi:hypothetical protein